MVEAFLNCWEVKDCGREPSGKNVSLYGVCRVAIETNLDGIHNGKNGGRCCWAAIPEHHNKIKKSVCCSGVIYECITCDFYKMVQCFYSLFLNAMCKTQILVLLLKQYEHQL